MGSRSSSGVALSAIALVACLVPVTAQARERGVVYASGVVSDDHSASVGATIAAPGGRLGQGWAFRFGVYGGDYSYDSGPFTVDADYLGAEAALVYQWSGDWGYGNVALGPRYANTDLSPSDPGNRREGSQWDVALTVDGSRKFGPWAVTGYASYGFDLEEYYARADLTYQLTPALALGVEIGAEGDNEDYSREVLGAVARIHEDGQPWAVKLSAGVRDGDDDSSAYGAVTLSRTF